MNYKSIFAAAALATAPALASAGTIDFTAAATYDNATASSITGSTVFNVGYTVTGKPAGELSFSQSYDGIPGATGGLAEQRDGLGVRDDEISNASGASVPPNSRKQAVTVAFDTAVSITGLHFLDLFRFGDDDRENMQVWVNRGESFDAFQGNGDIRVGARLAQNDPLTGYKFEDVTKGKDSDLFEQVTEIAFTSSRGNDAVGDADGALAGIDVTEFVPGGGDQLAPIPLPASILFLLGGLGSLAALRRRKTA